MGGLWRKAKLAFGIHLCVYGPRTLEDSSLSNEPPNPSNAVVASPADGSYDFLGSLPSTPAPISSGLSLSKSSIRSSKSSCAICLGTMKPGLGYALFTAECSHSFHFHCITSNVKHGNHVCPVCRAKWKEIPFQGHLSSELPLGKSRLNPVNWARDDGHMTLLRRLPCVNSLNHRNTMSPLFHVSEPRTFDDDEPLDFPTLTEAASYYDVDCSRIVEIKTYSEFPALSRLVSVENFIVLVHLKSPLDSQQASSGNSSVSLAAQTCRAPVDLVTVLDVSGSMSGTKLALLKRAMGFVIQNLRPSDRLSVISFSSTARRLFHLRRMTESGKHQALHAVNSLASGGGTNIAEGLSKASKVFEDRKMKNPVCSIVLLSDGHDTYTLNSVAEGSNNSRTEYHSLVPSSILGRGSSGLRIPIHVFGFGTDHDSASMHSISEISGGTFSFIETEGAIQDAFAQCIGGLLSVVVQELHLGLECLDPGVSLGQIKSGSYASKVLDNGRRGSIEVGSLYAGEERDFLLSVRIPQAYHSQDTSLFRVSCSYENPMSMETVKVECEEVRIQRLEFDSEQTVSVEVDRQRNRLYAAEAIAEARAVAENGALDDAVTTLEECRKKLSASVARQVGDGLSAALDAELKEMQERMASRQRYEASGRAFVLSGLSSHSWQRATARGNSTDSSSLLHAYQTPSMVEMLHKSQTLNSSVLPPNRAMRPSRSFPARPHPR